MTIPPPLKRGAPFALLMALLCCLALLPCITWDARFCFTCGYRIETGELRGYQVCSLHYQTRLGAFVRDQGSTVDTCLHSHMTVGKKGGWELVLAEHPLFDDRND